MPLKNREWNAPPALPADDSQPEPLQREAKRLNDANAKVAELRVAADALDKKTTVAYAHDKRTDRRPFFQSVLAALRGEVEISEAIAICYGAVQRHRQAAHVDAEAKLREAVENVRKKLCIPAAVEFVPLACLQNSREWWQAKALLDSLPPPAVGWGAYIPAATEEIERDIGRYEKLIDREEARLRQEFAAVLETDEVVMRNQAEQAARDTARRERKEKVSALLVGAE